MERLTYRVDKDTVIENPNNNKIGAKTCLRKLAEYEDLEEQGKLPRLPCKVGDTVYVINENYNIVPDKVKEIHLRLFDDIKVYNVTLIKNGLCKWGDFGKTVFLTEEGAKAVLEKIKKQECR